MIKKLSYTLGVIFLAFTLTACSSPEEKAADYVSSAETLFDDGKLKKAELEYRNALQVNQNLPDAWYGLAKIYERKQEWRKAFGALTKIKEVNPRHVDGRIMLGQILLASNQIDLALLDAKDILEMAPDDARSHSLMAAVQFRLENYKGAQEEVDKALAIDSVNNEAILVRARVFIAEKRYSEALAVLDKAIALNPENVSMYLMKIQAYQENNDKKAIEQVYLTLADRFPENVAFKHALARIYIFANDIDSSERILEQIVQSSPSNIDEKIRFVSFKNQYRSVDDAIALLQNYIDADEEEFRFRFLLGELYERSQQTDRALSVYQAIIEADELQTNGLEARNNIALIQLRAGKSDEAVALVNEVLTQDKNNENALLLQAGFHIAAQKFDDAIVSARTVLRDNPDSIKALGLLGQAYDASGSSALAVESYTKAFRLNPGTPVIANQLASHMVRQRKMTQADEVLLESVSKGNRSVTALKLLVQVKLSLGEWDKAEELAKRLQKIKGQEAASQQALGVVYLGKEQQDASIDAFKRAHELAPTSAQPLVALVRTYVRDGNVEDARNFLDTVLSVDSANITAYLLLGQLSMSEGNSAEAKKYFEKVIEINPKAEAGYRNLVSVYLRANDLEKAEKVSKKGLSELPGRQTLAVNLASIYERQNEFGKAIEMYESLLEKNPNLIVAKNNLASLLTDHGGDQASLDRARTIAADLKDSQIPQFRDTYAWASVQSGTNMEEAVVILEGIVRDNEQVGVYHYHLGEAYRLKGDSEKAKAALKRAIELAGPGSDIREKANQSLQKITS